MLAVAAMTTFMLSLAAADLSLYPLTTTTLLQFGSADSVVTVLAPGPETTISVSESTLYTVGTITAVPAADGYVNYTIPLAHDNGVGKDDIVVTVGTETVTGVVIVAGMVLMDSGKIVSGDAGDGVVVGIEGSTTYEVKAIGVDGMPVDVSDATYTGMAMMSGTYMKQLDVDASSISMTMFTLALVKYRVSADGFKVMFEVPSITFAGEVHETVLKVTHSASTAPCVAMAGTYTSTDGMVKVPMYNVMTGSDVSISVGTSSAMADLAASTLTMPDQSIVFPFATAGTASITCDGVPAYSDGPIVIEVSTSSETLAKDFLGTLSEVEDADQLTATLSFTKLSPETLPLSLSNKVMDEFCKTIGGIGDCKLLSVVKGSALCNYIGNIAKGTGNKASGDLAGSVDTCALQTKVGMECEDLKFIGTETKAVGGSMVASASGLATWTIVLIAGLGALALIVLIMLGLLAVYRRSAEQSESDYSSSGPLGVPDPSDLLYEQSIVRDIYGRGDFPDGGPSAAQAEQREREAALREEFPRPPSSSGLSRGSATDDASSTYSV